MSDNLKRYCAIQSHLKQLFPAEPRGNQSRHLNTLAALVSGIIGSKSCQLPQIAKKTPDKTKHESRSKRFARFLQNKTATPETFFLPYAQALVQSLPPGPLVLVMDGSQIGRGCMALMLSVLYQKRALPLCWLVVSAKKGHFTQERHQRLLAQVTQIVPPNRQVIFLGDGEFDGPNLLADIAKAGWHCPNKTLCLPHRQERASGRSGLARRDVRPLADDGRWRPQTR